jgi:hypothetical protein
MQHQIKDVLLRRIYLDNENARHDPIDNEPEIIAHLIEHEFVKTLARDIANRGSTSPLDRIAVVPHPEIKEAFVTAEGNRRLCALKLLDDPDRAPEGERSFFRQLADKLANPIHTLEVVVFPDRTAARPWVSLRHEGPQDGIGTRSWTPRQKARFDEAGNRPTNPNILSVLLLDYALKHKLITDAEYRRISVTTITRYLENSVVRNTLGLMSRWDLKINVPESQFQAAVQKFLKDSLAGGKSGVTSRTNKQEREAYANRLRKENIAPSDRLKRPLQLDPKSSKPGVPASPTAARRHTRNPDLRSHVIPTDFVIPIKDRLLKRIYDELRGIDTEEFSFATAYLFRAFVEQSLRIFCKRHGLGHDAELHILAARVADKLEHDGVLKPLELKPLRMMASERDSRLSPESLGSWIHGAMIPTRTEINRRWESLQQCLEAVLLRLK